GTGIVSMADNGDQLAIVNGENAYIYSEDIGFVRVTDTDFQPAATISHIDSFFVTDRIGTNEFALSDSDDGLTWDSTLLASAEWISDQVVTTINYLERLLVFGQKSTEQWANVGAANFPFQRVKGAGMELGIIGPHAKTKDKSAVYFIGNDRVAYQYAGQV